MIKLIFKYISLNNKEFDFINNKEIIYFLNLFLKIIILYLLLSIKKTYLCIPKNIVEIDNKINETLYEKDLNFSKYSTKIKVIAIYFPQFIYFKYTYNNKTLNEWEIIEKINPLFNGHNQPRYMDANYADLKFINNSKIEFIKKQIKLAKSHGIYGFAINYYWFSGKIIYDEPINIFSENKEINFPFFLIWKNDKYELNYEESKRNILIENIYEPNDAQKLIEDIKKYFISLFYIKIKKKPILAIYEPLAIPNLSIFLSNLRKYAKKLGINNIFILGTKNEIEDFTNVKLFDYFFEFQPKNINFNEITKNKYFYYYIDLIYKGNIKNKNNNIYKGVILEWDNSPEMKNPKIFNEYSPKKLYFLIKKIIISNKIYQKNYNNFLFINGWNNWKDGSYLEPDNKYGYASINALSKALFKLNFRKYSTNLLNLSNNFENSQVALQAHIFYEDLILDIINKANNIPIKYDLFISTISIEIRNNIIKNITQNSNANQYEIIILENKGRDVLPLLIQLKKKIKKYKYLCHIHTKKSKTCPTIGTSWRNYLYNNLLGNKRIISEILSDFENNDKLGFIFPETFYDIIRQKNILTKNTLKYMKYILHKLFPNYGIGALIDFPAGNMFWARTNAIFQIFEYNFNRKFFKEKDQTNDTIMHGIERIWLYLVKINGYYYKTIFKSIN